MTESNTKRDGTIETTRSYGAEIASGGQNKAIHRKADANCSITIQQEDGTALMGGEKMRLTDADALKQTFCAECDHSIKCEDCDIDYHFEHLAPAIDAVEVVRCEDCRYYHVYLESNGHTEKGYGACDWINDKSVREDHFCSWGERRENENN